MKALRKSVKVLRHFLGAFAVCFLCMGLADARVNAASTEIGFAANLFCTSDAGPANNVQLSWATTLGADSYAVYRSLSPSGGFEEIYTGTGTSCQDYDLMTGVTYYYKVAVNGTSGTAESDVQAVTPCNLPSGLDSFSNQTGGSINYGPSDTLVDGVYYNYAVRSHEGENDIYLVEQTSKDGVNFTDSRTVIDKSANEALASCKLESVQMTYAKSIGKMVIWAHWEKPSGYNDGKALVITGTPGGEFTVHHVYNPLGIYVRDMTIFMDDDGTGYLVTASNVEGQGANATISIFKMNSTYSDVTEVVAKVHENQYREFPHMIKRDGYYYLFTSQAAGWYPSQGGYISTNNLAGTWSELRSIGNTSTFSSQSGWLMHLGQNQNFLMHAYRWLRAEESSGVTLCPVYFSNGFAFYDYYPSILYNVTSGDLYPVQYGKLASQNKMATASLPAASGHEADKAFNGSYTDSYTASKSSWPFYLQVDLEQVYQLSNLQVSWYMCKGSEGYYAYTVEGSVDGVNWTTLLDHTDTGAAIVNSTYGFNSDLFSGTARYVRLNVKNAHLHNNPNNWYTPTVYEVKIFGEPVSQSEVTPIVRYNYDENLSGNKCADVSGNGNDAVLYGNAAYVKDAEKGNVLYLDGSKDTYVQLPTGMLDYCNDLTVSMDIKTEMTGDFFTFALGQNDYKYYFYKAGGAQIRYGITTNHWENETGLSYNLNGSTWHNYTAVLNGATLKLYVDGILVSQTASIATRIDELGTALQCYLGKSFYSADAYFKGYLDNVVIYRQALTPSEIAAMLN